MDPAMVEAMVEGAESPAEEAAETPAEEADEDADEADVLDAADQQDAPQAPLLVEPTP
jgi:hypothetical protein